MTDSAKPHLTARPAFSLRAWLDAPVPATPWQARVQQSLNQWRRFRRNTSALFGLIVILFIVTVAIFAPWLATHDIYAQNLHLRLAPVSREYWLGTDELGRDIYSRLIYGARITLYITGLTALIVGPLGLLVGTLAGTVGGWTDTILMRIVDIFLAFPS